MSTPAAKISPTIATRNKEQFSAAVMSLRVAALAIDNM
jgi:hypothetical protein